MRDRDMVEKIVERLERERSARAVGEEKRETEDGKSSLGEDGSSA